jgi:hypothetical protein
MYVSLTGLVSIIVISTDTDGFPVPNEPFGSTCSTAGRRGNGKDESNQVRKFGLMIFERTVLQ